MRGGRQLGWIVLMIVAGLGGGAVAVWHHLRQTAGVELPAPAIGMPTASVEPSSSETGSDHTTARVLPPLPLSPYWSQHPEREVQLRELLVAAEQSRWKTGPLFRLAAFFHDADEHWAVRVVLDQLLAVDPENEAALGLSGVNELRLGHLDRAAATFRQVTELLPDSWNSWYHLGLAQLRLRERVEAVESFRVAIRRDEQVKWPRTALGLALLRLGRPAEALAQFDSPALAESPPPSTLIHRMHALERMGDLKRADAAFRAYLQSHTVGTVPDPFRLRQEHNPATLPEAAPLRFSEVLASAGQPRDGRGRGALLADLDGDGQPELLLGFLEESGRLFSVQERGARLLDRTSGSGLGFFDNGYGLSLGDVDNDGRPDLYVTRGGFQNGRMGRDANLLFRNLGGGRFEDVTRTAGVGDVGTGFSSVFADFDRDGWLDCFVVNHRESCRLFRNLGDGKFSDITATAGLEHSTTAISAVAADFDDDGDPDLFVSVNSAPSRLYRNDTPFPPDPTLAGGGLRFTEVGFPARVALTGGFGCTVADFDNDGRLDLFMAVLNNWYGGDRFEPGDPCHLFLNRGELRFEDVAMAAGVAYVGGATSPVAADFDGDGWVDLYLGTGGPEPRRAEPDVLYRNLGVARAGAGAGPRFAEVTRAAGMYRPDLAGRGVAVGDLDGDLDPDLVVPGGTHVESEAGAAVLWRNDGPQGHRVVLRLVGTRSNRSAIGARVTLRAGELLRVEEVGGAAGFGGHRSLDLFFGLGERAQIDELTIRWPSGERSQAARPVVDRLLVITEGQEGFEIK